MTNRIGTFAVTAVMFLAPALAWAQNESAWPLAAADATPPYDVPPAPSDVPAPPAQVQAQPSGQVPPGQWVYTQQYGWIWMPYADAYTRVPANGYGEPYAYVYYPAYGWTWLAAPWVWGIGPWPVFGVYGPAHFAWYGHGWWRNPGYWHYAPARAWYGGHPFTPYRGGAGWNHGPAPYGGRAPSHVSMTGSGRPASPGYGARGGGWSSGGNGGWSGGGHGGGGWSGGGIGGGGWSGGGHPGGGNGSGGRSGGGGHGGGGRSGGGGHGGGGRSGGGGHGGGH